MAKSLSNIIRAGGGTNPLQVANGGTGLTTITANSVLLGNGTSAPQLVAPGTSGNILTSNGTTWTSSAAPTSGGVTLLATLTTTAGATSISATGLGGYKILTVVFPYPGSNAATNNTGSNFINFSSNGGTTWSVDYTLYGSSNTPTGAVRIYNVGIVARKFFYSFASGAYNQNSITETGLIDAIRIQPPGGIGVQTFLAGYVYYIYGEK